MATDAPEPLPAVYDFTPAQVDEVHKSKKTPAKLRDFASALTTARLSPEASTGASVPCV